MSKNGENVNWDKLVTDRAVADGINAGALGVVESKRQQKVARRFAKWQRDQVASDEAVRKASQDNTVIALAEDAGCNPDDVIMTALEALGLRDV